LTEPVNSVTPPEQAVTGQEAQTSTQELPSGILPDIATQSGAFAPSFSDNLKKTHAETAKTLSYWLVGILGGTVFLHYICVMILVLLSKDYELPIIEDILHVWLPVLAGLAGSAATYYFTRERS